MGKSKLRLALKGFDDMLAAVQKAGGDVDKAARDCMEKSVQVLESNLKKEAQASGADTSTVTHGVTQKGNRISAETGWKLGDYDADNPSEGYRAMFVEFGTGRHSARGKGKDRKTAAGYNRGSTEPRPFMDKARKKSVKQIRAMQQETLQHITKELGGK